MNEENNLPETDQDIPMPETREIRVTDFLDEFVEDLRRQLENDHLRWGNTWLKRTKEGQEDRTRKRYDAYFDQFENAGTPVPWMKIVGGALICWLREKHPELCNPVLKDYFEILQEKVMHECIGAKLERIYVIPATKKGYKSISLNFDNGRNLCFEISTSGPIEVSEGTWELVKPDDENEIVVEPINIGNINEIGYENENNKKASL